MCSSLRVATIIQGCCSKKSFPSFESRRLPVFRNSSVGTGTTRTTMAENYIQQVISSIEKSASDQREYRGLVLKNQLRILLISDPKTYKSAASFSVAVGSLSDPDELPGLAHFCEHMLFMGSDKYPDENDYEKFISENGGSTNAFTFEDYTTYYHDISPEALVPSLDRLAQFLIAPLFTASATEREVHAVDSEHDQNIPDDDWRHIEIVKKTSDPRHPYSKFGTGNLDTLWTRPIEKNIDIRSALLKFHQTYYSANMITVAILGSESLDDLTKIVTELFHPVLNKNVEMPTWPQPAFSKVELQTCVYDVPIKDLRKLTILFPVPDMSPHYKSGIEEYVTHLLGHEGPGSLLSYLKVRNWANGLVADSETTARGFGMFSIDIELSEDGLKNKDEIVTLVFQYLKMVKEAGPLKWIWEEIKNVNAMLFRFRDKEDPINFVSDLSGSMITYPLEHVLSASRVITEFDPEKIRDFLGYFTTNNFRLIVTTKKNKPKANRKEEFYGIEYSVEHIENDLIEKWSKCELHDSLKLPMVNEFIPTVFDFKKRHDTGIVPQIILTTPLSCVWYLQDNEFMFPKAAVYIDFFTSLPLSDPLQAVLNRMLINTLEDSLTEFAYQAEIAGLSYSISETIHGLQIWCGGYNHKLQILLERVLKKLINYTLDSERFVVLKEALSRDLRNWQKEQPKDHAAWYLTYLLRQKRWTNAQLIDSLPEVTPENVANYAKRFLSSLRLEWLIYGNVDQEESQQLVTNCEYMLHSVGTSPLPLEEYHLMRELKLKPGEDFVYNKEHLYHSDSCVAVVHQCGPSTTRSKVLLELLHQIICEPCFDVLRTKEQLGYTVWSDVRQSNGTQGLQILVQSKYHPRFLECRIDCFLETFYESLFAMSDAEFLRNRMALKVRKMEKPKKIWDRARLLWEEIAYRQYQFDRQNVELQELDKIGRQDIITYFSELIGNGTPSNSRKRLAVHIVSMTKKGAGKKENVIRDESRNKHPRLSTAIDDVTEWKKCHEFYEQPGPLKAPA